MITQDWNRNCWQFGLAGSLALVSVLLPFSRDCALAQSKITPDNTLGAESSIVVPNFNGRPVEAIGGGARRGVNLFHSFQEFNIAAGRGAYFFSPNVQIQNILARVTGGNPSHILGTLGTFGASNPNLFLINPNGIIFGKDASLDVKGSFVATTANAMQLGNTGLFSASEPSASNLLSVKPSALFFNALSNQAIVNSSTASSTVLGSPTNGLQVPNGQSLLLVGGDVSLDSSVLRAPGGRVELGGLAGVGTVGLNVNDNNLRLSFPQRVQRADVSLTNGSRVNVSAGGGGSIAVNARNLNISGVSSLIAGIKLGAGAVGSKAGDIEIDATDAVTIDGTSSTNYSSGMVNIVLGLGTAGNILINTGTLNITDNAQIGSLTEGQGNAGNVIIKAGDNVSISGVNSGVASLVGQSGMGNGAGINIQARSLSLSNSAQVATSTAGRGNAGNIQIKASDSVSVSSGALLRADSYGLGSAGNVTVQAEGGTVSFNGVGTTSGVSSGIISLVGPLLVPGGIANRKGGNIDIKAGTLSITDGAQLIASTNTQGNAGDININASNIITLSGVNNKSPSAVESNVEAGAVGNSGRINITAQSLSLTNGAQIQTLVRDASALLPGGRGNAGDVNITTRDTFRADGVNSAIFSSLGLGAMGKGGDITIAAGSLSLTNGAQLNASTSGQGDAGSVSVLANDSVFFSKSSYIFSTVEAGAVGNGGGINITAQSLSLTDGAQIQTLVRDASSTLPGGRGKAGDINIIARDTFRADGVNNGISSGVISSLGLGAMGKGGNITIAAGSLSLTNGAQLSSGTFGQGNAGSISVQANGPVSLANASAGILSTVEPMAVGNGGGINITAQSLSLTKGAEIQTLVRDTSNNLSAGRRNAGDVNIIARDTFRADGVNSGVISSLGLGAIGKGGDISVTTGSFFLTNGAQLNNSTFGKGNAGNVTITATGPVSFDGTNNGLLSGVFSTVNTEALGNGGDVNIQARSLLLSNSAGIATTSLGTGSAGNLSVRTGNLTLDRGAFLSAETASGNGGNIKLQLQDLLLLRHGSQISTSAGTEQAGGDGGNITIDPLFIIAVPSENSDIRANAYKGNGGNIQIATQGIFGIQGRKQDTPQSDITASSQFGLNGTVKINTPGIDPSRGLVTLPTNVVDPSRQIAQGCGTGRGQATSRFVVTGRGGLPPNPGETLSSEAVLTNWVTLDSGVKKPSGAAASTNSAREKTPAEIIEAQGWVIEPNGEVILTAEAPTVTPHSPWQKPASCHGL